MTEKAWLTDTEPSGKYPVYTRLNAADVMADPVTPLGATLGWIPNVLPGWSTGYVENNAFTAAELDSEPSAVAGFFYGHLYVNQSVVRIVGIRQGIGWEAIDAAFFNSPGSPPHASSDTDINEALAPAAAAGIGWVLTTTSFPIIEEDRAIADRCRIERPNLKAASNRALIARARSVMPLERLMWRGETIASSNSAIGPSVAASMLGAEKAHLLVAILGHAGDVDSAAPSYALWGLSRTVRSDATLSALFDTGVAAVAAQLPTATGAFWVEFAGFISEFGYRGPSEWDLGTDSWESKPELALGLIDRLRHLGDADSPMSRQNAQAAATESAMAQALAGMDEATAGVFRGAIASGRRFGAWRERGKANCIKVMNEARMPMLELGRRLEASGSLEHARHIFMALDAELDAVSRDDGVYRETLKAREADWKGLFGLDIPTFLDGSKPLPALSSLKQKADLDITVAVTGDVLKGASASTGIAEGPARVVLSTDAIADFQPGEILVAPQTDPSWTPLFMVASAVVVNTGSMGSHAMIVARELGIPCVAGLPGATSRIKTGTMLRVDGAAGTVTIL
jgi:phosphohistidine swiveling domain-containing protein